MNPQTYVTQVFAAIKLLRPRPVDEFQRGFDDALLLSCYCLDAPSLLPAGGSVRPDHPTRPGGAMLAREEAA